MGDLIKNTNVEKYLKLLLNNKPIAIIIVMSVAINFLIPYWSLLKDKPVLTKIPTANNIVKADSSILSNNTVGNGNTQYFAPVTIINNSNQKKSNKKHNSENKNIRFEKNQIKGNVNIVTNGTITNNN